MSIVNPAPEPVDDAEALAAWKAENPDVVKSNKDLAADSEAFLAERLKRA